MKKIMRSMLAFVVVFALAIGICGSLTGTEAQAAAKKATFTAAQSLVTVAAGASAKLEYEYTNVKTIKSQTWTSKNKKVAKVSKTGTVTGVAAGTAKINCKVKYIAKGAKKTTVNTIVFTVKVAAVPEATPMPEVTARPEIVYLNNALTADDISLRIKWDDTSNVGEARTVTIKGGTSDSMVVKDNGTMRKKLSAQYLADNEMGVGINLGNTLEATLSIADKKNATEAAQFETAWGQPVTTQEYIDCLHSYGINTIRIPVAWSNMVDEKNNYKINEKYLGRVEEVVNYALNDGMYVIINDHWDSQWWGQFGAAKWANKAQTKKVANTTMRKNAWKRYRSFWKQISARFKSYSDHLIFEGANEELGTRLNDTIYSNGYCTSDDPNDTRIKGNLTEDELYETVNKINQTFVDIVRASGGNNKYRHLLIPGYNTNIEDTADYRFQMPTDTIASNGISKLFLSVHYYTPWNFCGDGNIGNYTNIDQKITEQQFSYLQRFVDEGYAIIVGEGGICNPAGVDGSVSQWYNDAFTQAQKYHAVLCTWETGQYFNRTAAKIKYKDIAVFYNTVTGANGDTSMEKLTGKVNNTISENCFVDVSNMTPAWSWTGKWYKNDGTSTVGDDRHNGGGTTVIDDGNTDITKLFVPESNVKSTIDGDKTSIAFNEWGYQAFLNIDLTKYKNPVVAVTFDPSGNGEEGPGDFKGCLGEDATYQEDVSIAYDMYNGKGIILSRVFDMYTYTDNLNFTFGNGPTVTGIYLYELGE